MTSDNKNPRQSSPVSLGGPHKEEGEDKLLAPGSCVHCACGVEGGQ